LFIYAMLLILYPSILCNSTGIKIQISEGSFESILGDFFPVIIEQVENMKLRDIRLQSIQAMGNLIDVVVSDFHIKNCEAKKENLKVTFDAPNIVGISLTGLKGYGYTTLTVTVKSFLGNTDERGVLYFNATNLDFKAQATIESIEINKEHFIPTCKIKQIELLNPEYDFDIKGESAIEDLVKKTKDKIRIQVDEQLRLASRKLVQRIAQDFIGIGIEQIPTVFPLTSYFNRTLGIDTSLIATPSANNGILELWFKSELIVEKIKSIK
jgi:hypothetical protein